MKFVSFVMIFLFAQVAVGQQDSLQIFGHRGCRGLFPENSIVGFQNAVSLGVDGIEFDVVVNKGGQLVVSHEPYMKKNYCLDSEGKPLTKIKSNIIYEMTQEEIQQFNCGSIENKKFPNQQLMSTSKPLLQEVLNSVDFSSTNILFEIKSSPKEYGLSQPEPKEFVRLILNELDSFKFNDHITFMSFDTAILEELKSNTDEKNQLPNGSELKTVYLTYLPLKSPKNFLNDLSFQPTALGMFSPTIKRRKVSYLHNKGIMVFAWTVNEEKKVEKLRRLGIDGVITDFPDRMK